MADQGRSRSDRPAQCEGRAFGIREGQGGFCRTALITGSSFPITRHFEFEGYFEHQSDSGGSPNRTVNAVGVAANLYF